MRSFRGVAVLALTIAVAGCGDKVAARPSLEPTSASAPPCPESGVMLWLREPTAAMGLRSMSIELYNCGERERVLNGYPTVRLMDSGRKPIKATVGHGSSGVAVVKSDDRPPSEVTLIPGEVAAAEILWRIPVDGDSGRAVTADIIAVTPRPGDPEERLFDAGIDLGTTRNLGLRPWQKIRESNGAEVGDNAPHYADNHAFRSRVDLDAADRMAGELAVRKIRPALERLRADGEISVGSVRTALAWVGFPNAGVIDGTETKEVVYRLGTRGRTCVFGLVRPDRVTAKVDGITMEGGCG